MTTHHKQERARARRDAAGRREADAARTWQAGITYLATLGAGERQAAIESGAVAIGERRRVATRGHFRRVAATRRPLLLGAGEGAEFVRAVARELGLTRRAFDVGAGRWREALDGDGAGECQRMHPLTGRLVPGQRWSKADLIPGREREERAKPYAQPVADADGLLRASGKPWRDGGALRGSFVGADFVRAVARDIACQADKGHPKRLGEWLDILDPTAHAARLLDDAARRAARGVARGKVSATSRDEAREAARAALICYGARTARRSRGVVPLAGAVAMATGHAAPMSGAREAARRSLRGDLLGGIRGGRDGLDGVRRESFDIFTPGEGWETRGGPAHAAGAVNLWGVVYRIGAEDDGAPWVVSGEASEAMHRALALARACRRAVGARVAAMRAAWVAAGPIAAATVGGTVTASNVARARGRTLQAYRARAARVSRVLVACALGWSMQLACARAGFGWRARRGCSCAFEAAFDASGIRRAVVRPAGEAGAVGWDGPAVPLGRDGGARPGVSQGSGARLGLTATERARAFASGWFK